MFQKRMQRSALAWTAAALLLAGPLHAAGWTVREAPGLLREAPSLLETAWEWLVERVMGPGTNQESPRAMAEATELPPSGGPGMEGPEDGPTGDDGICIDPNG